MKCFWCGKELHDNGIGRFPCPYCGAEIRTGKNRSREEPPSEWFPDEDEDGRNDDTLLALQPPRYLKVETAIDGMWPVTTITFKRFDFQVLFLIPFTCVWAGGSMWMLYGQQIVERTFDLEATLFGIPFLIGSVVLVWQCLFMLFGKRVLTLSGGNGRYFVGVGPIGRTVRFKYDRNTQVESYGPICITNKHDSNSVCICSGFSNDALRYVAAILRRECKRV